MRRTHISFLALILIFTGIAVNPASAASFNCGSGGSYNVVAGHVTSSLNCSGELTIDSSVTAIDSYAFAAMRLTFDGGIAQYPSITVLTIPNTVLSIGASAFVGNTTMTSISIANSVTTIGRLVFRQNKNVTELTIGSGAAQIESDTYQQFEYISKVIVPEGVTRIDPGAFTELYSVTSFTLPSTLTDLRGTSLRGMHSLRTINIPTSLSTVADYFGYLTTPLSVPYLCTTTGSSNTSAVNTYFATLISVNTDAGRCANSFSAPVITSVSKPSSTSATINFTPPSNSGNGSGIGSYSVVAFPGGKRATVSGSSARSITIGSLNADTEYSFEITAINNESPVITSPPSTRRGVFTCYTLTGTTISAGSTCSGALVIPDNVTSIANQTFQDSPLESITFGSGSMLTSIGGSAFLRASHLTGIVIPNGVTIIEPFTFTETFALASVTLPDSLVSIGSGAFNNARSLISVVIPNNVVTMGDGAFFGASALETVTISSGSKLTSIPAFTFYGTTALKKITIPACIASIGDYAFQDASLLDSVYFSGTDSPTVGIEAFSRVKSGAKAYVATGVTAFGALGSTWKGLIVSSATVAPDAPIIGTATALTPTSASISFTAPTNNGGAAIETYTATSSPGSIRGTVLQSGSGSITITGLTPSTAYTFRITAANNAGVSSASSATVSITMPASEEELAAIAAAKVAAALAAQKIAEAKRAADKKYAQNQLINNYIYYQSSDIVIYNQAEILGVTSKNKSEFEAEVFSQPYDCRTDINLIMNMAYKYEVMDIISTNKNYPIYTNTLIDIGLITKDNKYKSALTYDINRFQESDKSTYKLMQAAIAKRMAIIEARKARLAAVLARNKARAS